MPLNGNINDSIVEPNATLFSSYVFYNNSGFETAGGVAAAMDDPTINPLTSKVLRQSSAATQKTTFANVINYSSGINGLVSDVNDLATRTLTASDFIFRRPTTLGE